VPYINKEYLCLANKAKNAVVMFIIERYRKRCSVDTLRNIKNAMFVWYGTRSYNSDGIDKQPRGAV